MATPLAVNEFNLVRVLGYIGDQQVLNQFWYRVDFYTAPDTLADLMNSFVTVWRAAFLPLFYSGYRVRRYEAMRLDAPIRNNHVPPSLVYQWAGYSAQAGDPGTDVGGLAGPPNPYEVALTVNVTCQGNPQVDTKYWPNDGPVPPAPFQERRFHGSIRFGSTTQAQLDPLVDDQWLAATTNAYGVAFAQLLALNLPAFSQVSLWLESRQMAGWPDNRSVAGIPHVAFQQIDLIEPELIVGSQDTRKERRSRY